MPNPSQSYGVQNFCTPTVGVCVLIMVASQHRATGRKGVQHHAARATLNDWSRPKSTDTANVITSPSPTQYSKGSPSSMLEFLGWKPLEECRLHYKLSLMYKIDQGIVAIPATVYLQPVTYNHLWP